MLVDRARLEFDELVEAVGQQDDESVGQEIADILILLYRVATLHNRDIDEIVQAKMRINRARTWVRKGDTAGYAAIDAARQNAALGLQSDPDWLPAAVKY